MLAEGKTYPYAKYYSNVLAQDAPSYMRHPWILKGYRVGVSPLMLLFTSKPTPPYKHPGGGGGGCTV